MIVNKAMIVNNERGSVEVKREGKSVNEECSV